MLLLVFNQWPCESNFIHMFKSTRLTLRYLPITVGERRRESHASVLSRITGVKETGTCEARRVLLFH